jgi:hypothetical protein
MASEPWAEPTQPVARRTDPETSHQAASSVHDVRESQWRIFILLNELDGATDEELVANVRSLGWPMSDSGVRTRRHELVQHGMVYDSGDRRLTRSNRQTIVWKVIEQ